MKNVPELIDNWALRLLINAIRQFYKKDARELFLDKPIDERAISGCISKYLWSAISLLDQSLSVDIEYDKMHLEEDIVRKCIYICSFECRECVYYSRCAKLFKKKTETQDNFKYYFRPDIIIHRRNQNERGDNIIIIEIKKWNSKHSLCEFDKAKILWCTCSRGALSYKTGAFVMLYEDLATIEWRELDGDWPQTIEVHL